ncbi:unnamed protein product [Merluccius merluccius]
MPPGVCHWQFDSSAFRGAQRPNVKQCSLRLFFRCFEYLKPLVSVSQLHRRQSPSAGLALSVLTVKRERWRGPRGPRCDPVSEARGGAATPRRSIHALRTPGTHASRVTRPMRSEERRRSKSVLTAHLTLPRGVGAAGLTLSGAGLAPRGAAVSLWLGGGPQRDGGPAGGRRTAQHPSKHGRAPDGSFQTLCPSLSITG